MIDMTTVYFHDICFPEWVKAYNTFLCHPAGFGFYYIIATHLVTVINFFITVDKWQIIELERYIVETKQTCLAPITDSELDTNAFNADSERQ